MATGKHIVEHAILGVDDTSTLDTRYAPIAKGVTNGDSHDHSGGDGAQIDHVNLSNKGTNTHTQIDTHIGSTSNPHSVTLAQVGGTTDHTALSNIGTNTHAQVDTHIAGTGTSVHGDSFVLNAGDTITGDLHVDGNITNYNSAAQDMGYATTSDKRGYGTDYVTDKRLSNCLIGGNHRSVNGALKVDNQNDPDTLEVYLRSQWNTIIYDMTTADGDFRHTPVSKSIYIWRGDSVLLGLNERPTVQEYTASMGAYPPARTMNGGNF